MQWSFRSTMTASATSGFVQCFLERDVQASGEQYGDFTFPPHARQSHRQEKPRFQRVSFRPEWPGAVHPPRRCCLIRPSNRSVRVDAVRSAAGGVGRAVAAGLPRQGPHARPLPIGGPADRPGGAHPSRVGPVLAPGSWEQERTGASALRLIFGRAVPDISHRPRHSPLIQELSTSSLITSGHLDHVVT